MGKRNKEKNTDKDRLEQSDREKGLNPIMGIEN